MRRLRRPAWAVGGSIIAVSLLACAIWAAAFRAPSVDIRPIPAPLIAANSIAGEQLLSNNPFAADYDDLSRSFESQSRAAYCGVASSVIVLNALHHNRTLTQSTFFTDATDRVRSSLRVTLGGMTLEQLGELLRAHDVQATVVFASDSNVDRFRAIASQNLQTPHDFVLVNYQRAVLGQGETGHISPIAAYNAQADRFLVLDVAAYKYPPVWVTTQDLWNAMNTIDPASGRSRGFVVVFDFD